VQSRLESCLVGIAELRCAIKAAFVPIDPIAQRRKDPFTSPDLAPIADERHVEPSFQVDRALVNCQT
jgi:hypothetical protein